MWTEPILHVDMDSFYVEVERLGRPELRGVPVAVGGVGPRGVIASASYEARGQGVASAQATSLAMRMCPDLLVVPPDHGSYADMSARVFAIFREFSPLVEGLSLDEAFLDVRGLRLHFETPVDVAVAIRSQLRAELGLPASVGVASVKFVAKVASAQAKPDGIRHVAVGDRLEFLHGLPVSALWGVGPATLAALERLGVESVADVAQLPEPALAGAVGPTTAQHLMALSHGIDPRPVVPDSAAKSISVEETFDSDLDGVEQVEAALLSASHRLSGRLRRAGLAGRTITLKVRFPDFVTVTRAHTSDVATNGARRIFHVCVDLSRALEIDRPVRLLGISATSLEQGDIGPRQLDLDQHSGWDDVEDAVAEVRNRFGDAAVRPARLTDDSFRRDPGKEP